MVVIPIPSPRNKIALLAVLVFGFNFTLSWTSFTPALYHSLLSWFRKTSPWTPGKLSWYLSHCLVFLARARARDRRLKGKGNKKGNLRVGVYKGHAKENVTKRRPQTPEKRRLYMADFLSIHSDSQANRVKVAEALFYFTGYNFLPTWKAIRYRMIGTGTGMKLVVMVPERGWRRWFVALNPSLPLNIYLRFSVVPVLALIFTCSRCYEELPACRRLLWSSGRNLTDMWRSTLKINEVKLRSVTEIAAKLPSGTVALSAIVFLSAPELSVILWS